MYGHKIGGDISWCYTFSVSATLRHSAEEEVVRPLDVTDPGTSSVNADTSPVAVKRCEHICALRQLCGRIPRRSKIEYNILFILSE